MNVLPVAVLAVGAYYLLSRSSGASGSTLFAPRRTLYGIDPRTGYPLGYPGGVAPVTAAGAHAGSTSPVGTIVSGITRAIGTILRPGNANPTPPRSSGPAGPSIGPYIPPGVPPSNFTFPAGWEDVPAPPDYLQQMPAEWYFENPGVNLPSWIPIGDPFPAIWQPPPDLDLRFDDPRGTPFDPTLGGAIKWNQ